MGLVKGAVVRCAFDPQDTFIVHHPDQWTESMGVGIWNPTGDCIYSDDHDRYAEVVNAAPDASKKVLTDEELEAIAVKACPGETSQIMQATVPNGPTPLSQGENIRRHIVGALRYARDNGYLSATDDEVTRLRDQNAALRSAAQVAADALVETRLVRTALYNLCQRDDETRRLMDDVHRLDATVHTALSGLRALGITPKGGG